MARITEISPQKKHPDRVNLFLDGEFFCGLDAFTAIKRRLKAGGDIDTRELEQIVLEDECASAFERAMRLINVRMRSETEVRSYLTEKQYHESVIDTTVEKLKDYRYIDDAEFARLYIEAHRKKWGSVKIRYALSQLGIESEVLDEVLREMPNQDEEAYRLAEKYCGGGDFDSRKLFAHLMRKGFSADTIKAAIARLKEQ